MNPTLLRFQKQHGVDGTRALDFARCCAVPVALTPELVHLIRVNLFPDLPYTIESDLLFSPLIEEAGPGLYELRRDLRKELLSELRGKEEGRHVAQLLARYGRARLPWAARGEAEEARYPSLETAQQFGAFAWLSPSKAREWLTSAQSNEALGMSREWFVAMEKEIETYVSNIRGKGTNYFNKITEFKLVFLGDAGNGKTTLAKQLRGEPFNPEEGKTDGIDIYPWYFLDGERQIRLNVWDLGGQEIYHATHQFFLTERTLYVLVLNSRQNESQNRLDYWLKTIRTLGNDAPILVVQNQHETNPHELNRKLLKEKYPTIQGFFQTSCYLGTGIAELRQAIQATIVTMPHMLNEMPEAYFQVKDHLEQDKRDFISYVEYQEICRNKEVYNNESQKILAGILHDLGIILYFQDDFRLMNTIVLNPEWITYGIYKIIDYSSIPAAKNAFLRLKTLDIILPSDRYPKDQRRYIIEMMMKFELCFQLEGRDEWLIPELLAPDEPQNAGDFTHALHFEYHYDFLPSSVLSRFIVRTHHLRHTYFWHDGVVLEDGANQARVRADIDENTIKIEVSGPPNTRRDLLAKIRDQFAHIHHTLKGMDVEEMIPIPNHTTAKPVPYAFLLQLEQARQETFDWGGVRDRLLVTDLLNGIAATRAVPFPERSSAKPKFAPPNGPQTVDIDIELKTIAEIVSVAEDNERYLRQLVRVPKENKLVPFVGAGMSLPIGMKSWTATLESLYERAEDTLTARQAREFGEARARWALDEAAQVLWEAMGDKWFNDRIKALFGRDTLSADKIKAAPVALLPQIASGPVLTTNFDAVLEHVYGDFDVHKDIVLGDSRADALLNRWDDKQHFLLKLHGDADESTGRVLTRAQYDRAYDDSTSRLPDLLRQLFASRRPLLFLGCSLEMDRTVEELRKVGLQMRNAYHFALLKDPGTAERNRRQNELVGKLGINPIWMRDYDDIRPILEFLVRVRSLGR